MALDARCCEFESDAQWRCLDPRNPAYLFVAVAALIRFTQIVVLYIHDTIFIGSTQSIGGDTPPT